MEFAPWASHTLCGMQVCEVHSGIQNAGGEPSWCRPNTGCHKHLAPFFQLNKHWNNASKVVAPCGADQAASVVSYRMEKPTDHDGLLLTRQLSQLLRCELKKVDLIRMLLHYIRVRQIQPKYSHNSVVFASWSIVLLVLSIRTKGMYITLLWWGNASLRYIRDGNGNQNFWLRSRDCSYWLEGMFDEGYGGLKYHRREVRGEFQRTGTQCVQSCL